MKFYLNRRDNRAFFILLFGLLTAPPVVFGGAAFDGKLKGVSIKETTSANQPPTPVINSRVVSESPYRVELDASASSDADNAITRYVWTIGEGTILTGPIINYEFTTDASVPVTLTVTDEAGALTIIQKTIVRPWEKAVNFQPEEAPLPAGFVKDSGAAFNAARGYGWTQPIHEYGMRDRNNSVSPTQAHDTLIFVATTSAWEISVPNGSYNVRVCMGDPLSYANSFQGVEVEGIPFISKEGLSEASRWIEREKRVNVIDQRITLTFSAASPYGQLCWLKITQAID